MMDGRAGEIDTGEARAMLDAFASVGTTAFDVTLTDIEKAGKSIKALSQAGR